MTDRIQGFTVTLNADIREDDVEQIRQAILCIKHVHSVVPHVADMEAHFARERARLDLWEKVRVVFFPERE